MNNIPPFLIPPSRPKNERVSANHLNELAYGMNRMNVGIDPANYELSTVQTDGGLASIPTYTARWTLTNGISTGPTISGLTQLFDQFNQAETIKAGEIILVNTIPGQSNIPDPGLYLSSSGIWAQIVSFNQVPIGTIISISSSPQILWIVVFYSSGPPPLHHSKSITQIGAFIISSIDQDVIVCNGLGALQTLLFPIVKPPLVRGSLTSWNGLQYHYSGADYQNRIAVNSAGVNEPQTVVPAYVIGDTLFAISSVAINGGLGSFNHTIPPPPSGGNLVTAAWQDLNVDGRAFAQIPPPS